VHCGFKISALIFPVGPEFKNLLIDGYQLPLNPGAIVKLFILMIEDKDTKRGQICENVRG
jgi:hypothetical protein